MYKGREHHVNTLHGNRFFNGTIVYFDLESLDIEYHRLLTSGLSFTLPPPTNQKWLWREAHLIDPDGNQGINGFTAIAAEVIIIMMNSLKAVFSAVIAVGYLFGLAHKKSEAQMCLAFTVLFMTPVSSIYESNQ